MNAPTKQCPCCGHPVIAVPVDALAAAPLSLMEIKIVECLARAHPRKVTLNALIEYVYADAWDGGPDQANKSVHVMIYRLRSKLPQYGWTIPKSRGGPGNFGFYGLEQIDG